MYSSAKIVHTSKLNDTVTVEELNEMVFNQLHLPAVIFVSICIVVGVVGNLLVLTIYKTRFRRSNHRYFILFLGVTDLLACLTGMPFLVASLRLPYMMTSVIACKVIRTIHYAVNNSSGLLLVVISIERYMKICRPFKKQFSPKQTLYLCFGTAVFSVIVAAPAAVFYGNNTIHTGIGNITGTQCYVSDEHAGKNYFELYMAALLLETIICIVIFAILYTFIIRKLWASDQFIETMRSVQKQGSKSDKDFPVNSRDELNSIEDSLDSRFESVYEKESNTHRIERFASSNQHESGGLTSIQKTRSVSNPTFTFVNQSNEPNKSFRATIAIGSTTGCVGVTPVTHVKGISPVQKKGPMVTNSDKSVCEADEQAVNKVKAISSVQGNWTAANNGSREWHDTTKSEITNSNSRFSLVIPRNNLLSAGKITARRSWNDLTDSQNVSSRPGLVRSLSPAQKQVYEQLLKKQTLEKDTKSSAPKRNNSKTTARVTVMLFTVTLVFVVAFVPHLTLMLLTIEVEGFVNHMSVTEVMVYQLFLRIFIINNIANPIIYFMFDAKFRTLCKSVFSKFCKRKVTY